MFGEKASRKRTGEGPGCHPFASLRASSERSEGSLRPSSQTLRGVYPERSEWAQGDRHSLQISEIVEVAYLLLRVEILTIQIELEISCYETEPLEIDTLPL